VTSSGITCTQADFGVTSSGEPVQRWTIDDGELSLGVLNLGGVIQSLTVPDAAGNRDDVVLGFDDVAGYQASKTFAGALIGRFANRIAGAQFELDGVKYEVSPNERGNTLHGGPDGFHRRIWKVQPHTDEFGSGLRLQLVSPDGDQGFPGRLDVTVDYLLVPGQRRLQIRYAARTDRPTVLNLTQHSYFNLGGVLPPRTAQAVSLDGHTLTVGSGHYTPVDSQLLPSGEIAHVIGTPFDLRSPQYLDFLSFDHNLVLDPQPDPSDQSADDGLHFAALLEHSANGRRLEIRTTEPGLQVYTGTGLDGSEVGKGSLAYLSGAGVALETQHFPDAPNHPEFPTVVLRPGEDFSSSTQWRFS
jgi:aldose 1-epimerase